MSPRVSTCSRCSGDCPVGYFPLMKRGPLQEVGMVLLVLTVELATGVTTILVLRCNDVFDGSDSFTVGYGD